MSTSHLESWDPLSPAQVAELLAPVEASWWIAGGWATDLLVGHQSRTHGDVDVLILRHDQHLFRSHLRGWDIHAVDPPGFLRPWAMDETLPSGVHDLWCRQEESAPWAFQFMIDDVEADDWVFRRDPAIRRPVESLWSRASRPGMPVLAPEIQLLYKSKGMRAKDVADFETVLPCLTVDERAWLRGALSLTKPDHEWIERL